MFNNATVPVAFGRVIVLSEPEASAAVSIISFASAVDPSNVIFPLSSVMELALSSEPEPETILVDCIELKPWNCVAPPPRETVVLPIRNELLAKLLLLIEDPVVHTIPDLSGNVIPQLENGRLKFSDEIPSWVTHFHVNRSYYNQTPIDFSGFLQNKIEYGDMIVNIGLRYDYFDANS